MSLMASQITSLTIVYSTVYSGADQRKHQSSASLAFVRGFHRRPVNSPHKWPVTRKIFPFDDVIMCWEYKSCDLHWKASNKVCIKVPHYWPVFNEIRPAHPIIRKTYTSKPHLRRGAADIQRPAYGNMVVVDSEPSIHHLPPSWRYNNGVWILSRDTSIERTIQIWYPP